MRERSPLTLYSSTCSKKMIGLSDRMALFSSAFAFAAVEQATSWTPGWTGSTTPVAGCARRPAAAPRRRGRGSPSAPAEEPHGWKRNPQVMLDPRAGVKGVSPVVETEARTLKGGSTVLVLSSVLAAGPTLLCLSRALKLRIIDATKPPSAQHQLDTCRQKCTVGPSKQSLVP